MSDQQPNDFNPDARIHFAGQPRDVYIFAVNDKPEIPDGMARQCPQCHELAWANSRWCWHCKFDFDRASMARWHPTKLLALSIALNIALALLLLGSFAFDHLRCP